MKVDPLIVKGFLLADSVCQPEQIEAVSCLGEGMDVDDYKRSVKELRADIDRVLEGFGGNGAFVKLNWKAAHDGKWLNHDL